MLRISRTRDVGSSMSDSRILEEAVVPTPFLQECNESEMCSVAALDHRIFPRGFPLTEDSTNTFRSLTFYSRIELMQPSNLRSHRPLIGPIIVRGKQILWAVLRVLLKEMIEHQKHFNTQLVVHLAKQEAAGFQKAESNF